MIDFGIPRITQIELYETTSRSFISSLKENLVNWI